MFANLIPAKVVETPQFLREPKSLTMASLTSLLYFKGWSGKWDLILPGVITMVLQLHITAWGEKFPTKMREESQSVELSGQDETREYSKNYHVIINKANFYYGRR